MRLRWQLDTMQPWVARWVRRCMDRIGVVPSQDHWLGVRRVQVKDDWIRQLHDLRSQDAEQHKREIAHLRKQSVGNATAIARQGGRKHPNKIFIVDMTDGHVTTDAHQHRRNQVKRKLRLSGDL